MLDGIQNDPWRLALDYADQVGNGGRRPLASVRAETAASDMAPASPPLLAALGLSSRRERRRSDIEAGGVSFRVQR